MQQTFIYAQQALENKMNTIKVNQKTSVVGVKGPSQLSLLMPKYVEGIAIDSMHAVSEGIVKKLLRLWFDSQFSAFPFSLRVVMLEIDTLFLKTRPPKAHSNIRIGRHLSIKIGYIIILYLF